MKRLILIMLAVALMPLAMVSQKADADTTVSVVTMYAGHDIYELEGHTILRISMPEGDYAVSYGTFDFDKPNFVYRFVKGETDYWVTTYPYTAMLYGYARQGRRIVEQRLDMTGDQKARLIELVRNNLLPENATYRYNYVKDNCATRPLRMVELAYGDSIMLGNPGTEYEGLNTWRKVMQHCHTNYPWYQFGIDLALGPGIDITLDNRQLAFAPVVLCDQLQNATVAGKKIVSDTLVINDVTPDNAIDTPTPWYLTPMCAMLLIMAIVLASCIMARKNKTVFRIVYLSFYGILTLIGCLIAFLVFVSVHEATSPNPLLAVFNPLCVIGVISFFSQRLIRLGRWWQMLNAALIVGVITYYIISGNHVNVAFWPIFIADLSLSATYLFVTCKKENPHTNAADC